jgi:hypothetical protein
MTVEQSPQGGHHYLKSRGVRLLGISLLGVLSLMLVACGANPLAGDWHGVVKLTAGKIVKQANKYSETKQSLTSNLHLNADGSYTAKLQDVDYTGDWAQSDQKVTLTPKTYMGMERSNFPATKTPTGGDAVARLYAPYNLDLSTDHKTLTHTDPLGTTTFVLGPA